MRPSAATRARKNHRMAVRSAPRRLQRRGRLGELRAALLEKRGAPLHSFRAHRMRRDALALEKHLRLERAEGLRDEPLGGAVRAAPSARELLGEAERASG